MTDESSSQIIQQPSNSRKSRSPRLPRAINRHHLILSSFLILVSVPIWAQDTALYCGLFGEIFIGITWRKPGGKLLSQDAEEVFVELGYLVLIVIVPLKANLLLSVGVGSTGIVLPIGFSFIPVALAGATYLQRFAAGAARCSASLGTTFTTAVLTSAAVLDNVVGLIINNVIADLGEIEQEESSFSDVTEIRPVLVSIAFYAFYAVTLLFCPFVLQPTIIVLNRWRSAHPKALLSELLRRRAATLVLHYAGMSTVFAAKVPHLPCPTEAIGGTPCGGRPIDRPEVIMEQPATEENATEISAYYFHSAPRWVLQPSFFASIGFSIPITRLFTGSIIWRGIIYTVVMTICKLACGLCCSSRPIQKNDASLQAEHPYWHPSLSESRRRNNNTIFNPPKLLSLQPGAIRSLARVARRDCFPYISSVAESKSVFGSGEGGNNQESEIFLIVTRLLVRRVLRLGTDTAGSKNVLGVWIVEGTARS
ncbi:cation/H+ exchanger [Xylariaceae sp. FL0255]|nr:cation/H+ exchanger [Xylariaceae sp. FL0255]